MKAFLITGIIIGICCAATPSPAIYGRFKPVYRLCFQDTPDTPKNPMGLQPSRAGEPWPPYFRIYASHYALRDSAAKNGLRPVNEEVVWFIGFDYAKKAIHLHKFPEDKDSVYRFDSVVTAAFLGDSERVFMRREIYNGREIWPFRVYLDRRTGWNGEYKMTWVNRDDHHQYDLRIVWPIPDSTALKPRESDPHLLDSIMMLNQSRP